MTRCYTCGGDQVEHQLGGFWFCFHCIDRARERGASYWRKLYRAMYPWR